MRKCKNCKSKPSRMEEFKGNKVMWFECECGRKTKSSTSASTTISNWNNEIE